jgi:hypothetical protein
MRPTLDARPHLGRASGGPSKSASDDSTMLLIALPSVERMISDC